MTTNKLLIIIFLLATFSASYSQPLDSLFVDSLAVANSQVYRISKDRALIFAKPGVFDFVKNAPGDLKAHAKSYIQRKNLPTLGAIALSTLFFVAVDQHIVDSANRFGKDVGISDRQYSLNLSPIPKVNVFFPSDLGTAMYFIGDGFTHLTIDVSFLVYGLAAKDNRALQTASQILEGLVVTSACVQILKHTTGRESPNRATCPGGVWRVFPNQIETVKNVPKYDAFPSGHLANFMSTMTIIAENYPEHKFIRPVGYTLMVLLTFQMLNNGVHWMSDYPLALFIGYDVAKHIVKKGRTVHNLSTASENLNNKNWLDSVDLSMAVFNNYGVGIQLNYRF